jgi:hypothetical protein
MPYTPSSQIDPWFIPHPEEGRAYRWISADIRRLDGHLRSYGDIPGYRLECRNTPEETLALCEKLGLPSTYVNKARNRIEYGDNILASIPDVERVRRFHESLEDTRQRLDQPKEKFYGQVESTPGMRVYEKPLEEHLDRKRHANREGRDRVSVPQNYQSRNR